MCPTAMLPATFHTTRNKRGIMVSAGSRRLSGPPRIRMIRMSAILPIMCAMWQDQTHLAGLRGRGVLPRRGRGGVPARGLFIVANVRVALDAASRAVGHATPLTLAGVIQRGAGIFSALFRVVGDIR
jgi:hypothetical protein